MSLDWNAIQRRLAGLGLYINQATCGAVLQLYEECKRPPSRKRVYNHIVDTVKDLQPCLDSLFVQLCIEQGDLHQAQILTAKLPYVSILVWNCLIQAYAHKGKAMQALTVLENMQEHHVELDKVTFLNAASACNNQDLLTYAKSLHHLIVLTGCEIDVVLATALVNMYSRCGSLDDASSFFERYWDRNVVSWTTIIGAYSRAQHFVKSFGLLERMRLETVMPNRVTFLCLLEGCTCQEMLAKGQQIHSCLTLDMKLDLTLITALINMYGKCDKLEDAEKLFRTAPQQDVALWNALIMASFRHNENSKAIQLFDCMYQEGMIPNSVTYVTMLSACTEYVSGKMIHARVIWTGIEDDIIIATALINMYGKCAKFKEAFLVFEDIEEKNIVAWNATVSACSQYKQVDHVFLLLNKMHEHCFLANKVTYISGLDACRSQKCFAYGKKLHCYILGSGFDSDTAVATALTNMYCWCCSFIDAWRAFNGIRERNAISWNTMVSACGHLGQGKLAFEFYDLMQWEGINPDQVTYTRMLSICANQLAELALGKHLHMCVMQKGFEPDSVVATSVLDMYGKCGSLDDACTIFDKMQKRNIVSWNAMISAYARHGCAREAIYLVNQMKHELIVPNNLTFSSIISACSHTGMLIEGYQSLSEIPVHDFKPSLVLYHCIIDLLGRAGLINVAESLLKRMPFKPSMVSWMTLLGACRNVSDAKRVECTAEHVFEMDSNNTAALSMLGNFCVAPPYENDKEVFLEVGVG